MNAVLEAVGIRKSYPGFALKDVSFSLMEGCITGFIGVNGAGKTTTIKSILGLTLKDGGEICFFGKSMKDNAQDFRNRIGIVLDEGCFYDELTLEDMKSILAPAYSRWDEAVFRKYLERFGLPPRQVIASLSKGMRMKYAIALALSHHAELLIMDEPTSGLDPEVRIELMEILLDFMKEEGRGVFFSSHITSDLERVADALILMDKGRILLQEEKDLLLDRHGRVKGDRKALNPEARKLFVTLRETDYGFEGLTSDKAAVRQQMSHVLIEKPTIEDVMLGYVRR
jgi:ABC-2 type transport system ATP-binding protein